MFKNHAHDFINIPEKVYSKEMNVGLFNPASPMVY